ncbi:dienelactone hydrolase [Nostocales cyanobacterium HT-58-2]|nr:dienelactone hydrolase [Nostocales cyanobacterium HT-58-2]
MDRWSAPKSWLRTLFGAFAFGILSNIVTTTPGLGAEEIEFYYPPFGEFSVSTSSLEAFAKEGKVTKEFSFYAKRVKPQQLAQLRGFLQTKLEVTPTLVSQFTYSAIGENLLKRLGELLLTETRQNGFYALRSALIISATDPEGLTVVNVLRRYPSPTIRLNLSKTQGIIGNLSQLLQKRNAIVVALKQTAEAEAASQPSMDFSQQPDLKRAGSLRSSKQTLTLNDNSRNRRFEVDLYLPQTETKTQNTQKPPFPVIVISHGVAEDRETFAYVAQHLASHGFAVAVLEHPGSDAKKFEQYFAGLTGSPQPTEFINRPLDVKFVLDELQRLSENNPTLKGQLNLQQVGAIGHSLGGYTVLALAGATINFEQIRKDCASNSSLNLSVFLQCRAAELQPNNYPLPDPRIKAVMALNPLNSIILGQKGLSQIQVPVMLVAGTQDIFTPAVPEQILPFTWLQTQNKYLALIENGTHFSAADKISPERKVLPVPSSLIGPDPAIAQSYVNALSLAFFQTHLSQQVQYRPYLSASYAKFISQPQLNLSLIQSFSVEQLSQIFSGAYPRSGTSTKGQPPLNTP